MDLANAPNYVNLNNPYQIAGDLWSLRIATRTFASVESLPFQIVHAVKDIAGLDSSSFNLKELPDLCVRMRERLATLETSRAPADAPLFRNVDALGQHLRLSVVECEVLTLRVMARLHTPLRIVLENMRDCDDYRLVDVFASALHKAPDEVRPALRRGSRLLQCGLLRLQKTICNPIERLSVLPGLSGILTQRYGSMNDLLAAFAYEAPPPSLSPDDYEYLDAKFRLLVSYMRGASASNSRGRNVLLYGGAGTGKTELARLAARTAGLRLYQASVEGDEGEPLGVKGRLHALVFLQNLVHTSGAACVLIDEVEDVFRPSDGPEPEKRTVTAADSKGWSVQLLETNTTLTIWISNRIRQIDPAILRRFDLAFEIPVPPLKARHRVLERSIGRPVPTEAAASAVIRDCEASPALITRAVEVASLIGETDTRDSIANLHTIISGHLRAIGVDPTPDVFVEAFPFSENFLNATHTLEELVRLLRSGGADRLLIHGPSGSGKTALAYYLARRIGTPMLRFTVRNLWGNYPAETEKNLARAFERASRDEALLLLDASDWLVGIARGARTPSELSALDQLCACLDKHNGVVACTTTARDGIEPSVVLRFCTRVRLDYLRFEQYEEILAHGQTRALIPGASSCMLAAARRIATISSLTPGDFAAASRAARHSPNYGTAVAEALDEAERLKRGQACRRIGF